MLPLLFRKSSTHVRAIVMEEWHHFFFFWSLSLSLEPPQDAEGQEDYEEESFEFSERENRANNNTPDVAKLSPMEYYGAYGKGTGRFSRT